MSPFEIICALTKRELDVCRQIAECRTSGQIAAGLCLTRQSIYNYEFRIRRKLGVRTRGELILRAQAVNRLLGRDLPNSD